MNEIPDKGDWVLVTHARVCVFAFRSDGFSRSVKSEKWIREARRNMHALAWLIHIYALVNLGLSTQLTAARKATVRIELLSRCPQ